MGYVISSRGITKTELKDKQKETLAKIGGCGSIPYGKFLLPKGATLGTPSGVVIPLLNDQEVNHTTPVILVSDNYYERTRQEFENTV